MKLKYTFYVLILVFCACVAQGVDLGIGVKVLSFSLKNNQKNPIYYLVTTRSKTDAAQITPEAFRMLKSNKKVQQSIDDSGNLMLLISQKPVAFGDLVQRYEFAKDKAVVVELNKDGVVVPSKELPLSLKFLGKKNVARSEVFKSSFTVQAKKELPSKPEHQPRHEAVPCKDDPIIAQIMHKLGVSDKNMIEGAIDQLQRSKEEQPKIEVEDYADINALLDDLSAQNVAQARENVAAIEGELEKAIQQEQESAAKRLKAILINASNALNSTSFIAEVDKIKALSVDKVLEQSMVRSMNQKLFDAIFDLKKVYYELLLVVRHANPLLSSFQDLVNIKNDLKQNPVPAKDALSRMLEAIPDALPAAPDITKINKDKLIKQIKGVRLE